MFENTKKILTSWYVPCDTAYSSLPLRSSSSFINAKIHVGKFTTFLIVHKFSNFTVLSSIFEEIISLFKLFFFFFN